MRGDLKYLKNCRNPRKSGMPELRSYFVHLPGAKALKMVHPAICLCVDYCRGENKVPRLRSQSGPFPYQFRGPHQNMLVPD